MVALNGPKAIFGGLARRDRQDFLLIALESTPHTLLRHAQRRALAVALLASLQAACAQLEPASYKPPVAEDVRASAETVAVVSIVSATDDTPPRLDVPIGQGQEAAKGAAMGVGAGFFAGVMVSAAGGPLGPVLAPIVIPAFTIGGMAGGSAVGWSAAVPAKDAAAANAALSRSRSDLSAEVARRIALQVPSVGKVAAAPDEAIPPDLRIEVSVDRWGLAGGAGSDPLTGFFVRTSYRVVKGSDNTTVAEGNFVEAGPQRTVSQWTSDDAALLFSAVDATLSRVAAAIIDGTFLVHNFRVSTPGLSRGEVCGLKPIEPGSLYRFGPYESGPRRVGSLTPRLVWESFPRRQDVEDDTAKILARVSDIRYDLRIWANERGGPGNVVYERTGLALTAKDDVVAHQMETPLAADSSYLWSVRARFTLDGKERVTRWAYDREINIDAIPMGFFGRRGWDGPEDPYRQGLARPGSCADDSIPPLHYFSFTTP